MAAAESQPTGADQPIDEEGARSVAQYKKRLAQSGATPIDPVKAAHRKAKAMGLAFEGPNPEAYIEDDGKIVAPNGSVISAPVTAYQVPEGIRPPKLDAQDQVSASAGGVGVETESPDVLGIQKHPYTGSASLAIDNNVTTGLVLAGATSTSRSGVVDEVFVKARAIANVGDATADYAGSFPRPDASSAQTDVLVNTVAGDASWESEGTHRFTEDGEITELRNSSAVGSSNFQVSSCNSFQRAPSDGTFFAYDDNIEVNWRTPCIGRVEQIRIVRINPNGPNENSGWKDASGTSGLLNGGWILHDEVYSDFGEYYDFPFTGGDYKWQVRVEGESGYTEGTFTVEAAPECKPTALGPQSGNYQSVFDVSFNWSAPSNCSPSAYQFRYVKTSPVGDPDVGFYSQTYEIQGATAFMIPDPEPNFNTPEGPGDYEWQVRAVGVSENNPWATANFSVVDDGSGIGIGD